MTVSARPLSRVMVPARTAALGLASKVNWNDSLRHQRHGAAGYRANARCGGSKGHGQAELAVAPPAALPTVKDAVPSVSNATLTFWILEPLASAM